jgi:hypothetical protein
MGMHIDFPTQLPVDEARRRLQALGDYLWNKHKIAVKWNGDSAEIKGRYLVVDIEGTVAVREGMVSFDGKDPGSLWRSKAKDYLSYKLKTYLDPATPFESLPKA